MNKETNLSRIEELATFISPYKVIADVGCDHGYLVIEAFEKAGVTKAYAIDNKQGPLDSAIHNTKNKNYFKDIIFSLSSGVKEIGFDTQCVVIAGMGGILISEILDDDLKNVKRLILEPNRDQYEVRKKISSLGFVITNEKIVFEKGKYYEIIVCDKEGKSVSYTEDELEFGPLLLKEKSLYFKEKWFTIYDNLKMIDNDEVRKKVERIKAVL